MITRRIKALLTAALATSLLAPSTIVTAKEMTAPSHDTATASSHFNLYKAVQRALDELGLDPGPVDGLWGTRSANALRQFQASRDLDATGTIDLATVKELGLADSQ